MNRIILTLLALIAASCVYAQEKHLFILSGQSNMKRLDPETSFTPAVRKAFGEDRVIVVKDAEGGQSIRRWYKEWKDVKNYKSMKPDTGADPSTIGDLYDRLLLRRLNIVIGGIADMGRAVSLVPDCVARRNPHIHYLKLQGGGAERTIALFWRKSSVRRDLILELVYDLSREYTTQGI